MLKIPGRLLLLLGSVLTTMPGYGSPVNVNPIILSRSAAPGAGGISATTTPQVVGQMRNGSRRGMSENTQWPSVTFLLAVSSGGKGTVGAPGAMNGHRSYGDMSLISKTDLVSTVRGDLISSAQLSITSTATDRITPTVTWTTPRAIRYGTALGTTQLDAKANVPGVLTYLPAAGTFLKAGTHTLNVTFNPIDDSTYNVVTKTVSIQVNQVVPTISWPAPVSIQQGTALSSAQLNATSNVFGTFSYAPAVGAVLPSGTEALSVSFSPNDKTDYASVTASNSITVNEASTQPQGCGGPTINLSEGMSQSAIQGAISSAPNCALVVFAAGTYDINSPLTIPCNSLTFTGPIATPATAEITTSAAYISLMAMYGGCTLGTTTIEYLNFNGAGPLYVDTGGYSNIIFEHNQVTSVPFEPNYYGTVSSLFFDGNVNNTDSNITIAYNTFGDSNSCTAGLEIDDGSCAGAIFNEVGYLTNLTVKYNYFYHLNEGMHWQQVGYNANGDQPVSTCNNCDVEYNYFNDIVRIALENQSSVVGAQTIMSNNVFGNPSPTLTYSSMALSAPCCLSGRMQNEHSTTAPTDTIQNNVMFNNLGTSTPTQIGLELAGNLVATNNLIQGDFCTGGAYGYNFGTPVIQNNTAQGYYMSSGAGCTFGPGGFWQEDGCTSCGPLSITNNTTGATPTAIPSVAPSIFPAPGAQSFPLTVTLTDPGYTSGNQPLGNTGIWYTTDGSAPVPGVGTAHYIASGGTITLSGPATVQAVGMWGTSPQPTSYPPGYGFVPSKVVTAAYSVSR
jgi:hypothetical protein